MSTTFDTRHLVGITELSGSLAQRVYTSLRQAILSLAYPPGTTIRKAAICQELGVSRSPVSEAIARLSNEGLVDVIPQSGTRVSLLSLDEIREAAFTREALEMAAAEKVAREHTEDQLAQLTRNVRLQRLLVEDHDFTGFYEADEAFHARIMEFTGYPGIASTVETISLKLKRPRILLLPETGRPMETIGEHEAILEAIRSRDPSAAREAMRYHLSQLVTRFGSLESEHPEFFRSK